MMNLITAIVMASGFSKRMGLNKLLMKYNDKFLIEYTLEKISQCDFVEKIIVKEYSLKWDKRRGRLLKCL